MGDNGMSSKVIERKYYGIRLRLASPLCISNGNDGETDADILLDSDGRAFIPGTSIAGAFRNALMHKKNADSFMGFSNGENGRMSQLFVSDVVLDNARIIIRDGVRLENKTVVPGAKFDMQAVETGATGLLYLEVVIRENDKDKAVYDEIDSIISKLASGEIRFGSRKTRGFGEIEVLAVAEEVFVLGGKEKNQVEEWMDFLDKKENPEAGFQSFCEIDDWLENRNKVESDYVHIEVPLTLEGGISIRRYSTKPGEADFEHICIENDNKRIPVIPGSSWNGAFRGDARRILQDDLLIHDSGKIIEMMFGPETNTTQKLWQSRITFSESQISDSVEMNVTRTAIDRFTAAAKNGSLYSEISFFGGNTKLDIMVSKQKKQGELDFRVIVGLLELIILDIMNGYVAIGGQVAIGRGIFSGKQNSIKCPDCNIKDCRKALHDYLFKEEKTE